MSTHKHFDKICCVVLAVTLLLTVLFMNADKLGIQKTDISMGYESRLFDTASVHTVDIVMDDWDGFIAECKDEEYRVCSVVIDGEAYKNIGIRAKGNTSLTQVDSYGNGRYSFKIEFDRYDSTKTYYGLDKLCLNNIIQDNTYMKDYLTYRMMSDIGVASPLCSYVYITVNGEDWGLYLAVEGIEEAFLQRNYGSDYGELYKPDSMNFGGGRGNGRDFDFDDFSDNAENEERSMTRDKNGKGEKRDFMQMPQMQMPNGENGVPPELPSGGGMQMPNGENFPFDGDFTPPDPNGDNAESIEMSSFGGMMGGSDGVLLKYVDDEIESYSDIFDSAKTPVTESDKKRLIASLKKLSENDDIENTVDVERVIKYFTVHNFVLNFDSYTGSMVHNYYLYEKDGKMQMLPWDYNLAFGGFKSADDATSLVNYPIDSPVSGGSVEDRPMIAWIFANEEYTELYHEAFSEFISEYFNSGYFETMFDETVSLISPYIEKDPTKFCTFEEFETGAATLREFCLLRAKSISGQLSGTIGATSDTQKSETLIDAGNLKISDMGSMNNSEGGRGDMHKTDFDSNEMPELPAEENAEADDALGENKSNDKRQNPAGDIMQKPTGEKDADFERMPNGETGADNSAVIMLAVSLAVLAAGLVFAFSFKRRK